MWVFTVQGLLVPYCVGLHRACWLHTGWSFIDWACWLHTVWSFTGWACWLRTLLAFTGLAGSILCGPSLAGLAGSILCGPSLAGLAGSILCGPSQGLLAPYCVGLHRACWLHTVWAFTGWACWLHTVWAFIGLAGSILCAPSQAGLAGSILNSTFRCLAGWWRADPNWAPGRAVEGNYQVSFDVKFTMKVHTCTVPHLAGLLKQEQKDQTSAMILGNLMSAKCR